MDETTKGGVHLTLLPPEPTPEEILKLFEKLTGRTATPEEEAEMCRVLLTAPPRCRFVPRALPR